MITFLTIYLSIYSLVHYYAFRKLQKAFSLNRVGRYSLASFMALMILAPIIVRVSERAGIEIGARFLAYICFTWMGLLFLFISMSAVVDLGRFAVLVGRIIKKKQEQKAGLQPRTATLIIMALVILVYGWGLVEANTIRREHLVISSPKIDPKLEKIRIAQISDVHLGLLVREKRLQAILAVVKEAHPDILISTGDLVDGQLNDLTELSRLLESYNPPLGKLAITGNHEFYAGLDEALSFTEKSGFTILRQQAIQLQNMSFVGVDDRTATVSGKSLLEREEELLAAQPKQNFVVLLKHRPEINLQTTGLYDLQLSGHTHRGQIFPFSLLVWLFYPNLSGEKEVGESILYVSRGSGTWGPPIRFLAPPEVTIIDVIPERGID